MTPVLVFGDDGSIGADAAWLWICEQRWPGWRVEVITAVPPPIGPPPGEAAGRPHSWEPPSPRRAFAESDLDPVVHLRADADPRLVLGGAVDASLLVIGPRGDGLLEALHLGSTAEYLVHDPPAPLVIARHGVPVRQVLAAVDGSPHARRAVEALAAMPWLGDVDGVAVLAVREHDRDDELGAALDDAARLLPAGLVETVTVEPRGTVTSTLLHEIGDRAADLAVLGTRGLGLLRRAIAGSTASAVARLADCAVLLAHADQSS